MTAAHVTLCFLLRNDAEGEHVLLGTKKTGFGSGKVVGVGGHVEPGETAVEAAVREVMEEINVVVRAADLVQAGTVDFIFPARPEWNMATTVYLTRTWIGSHRKAMRSPQTGIRWRGFPWNACGRTPNTGCRP